MTDLLTSRTAPDTLVLDTAMVWLGALIPVLLGAGLAFMARQAGLRWHWPMLALAALAPVAVLLRGQVSPAALAAALRDDAHLELALRAAVPAALLCAAGAAGTMLWKERRDRDLGGDAQRRLDARVSPLDWLRQRRERRLSTQAFVAGRGYQLGCDERGDRVFLEAPRTHMTIVGGSGSGKTNTAEVLLEAHVAAGGGCVILDGKGGRDLPHTLLRLSAEYDRPVLLWSLAPYGHESLDTLRAPWNPLGVGNPTELKDRIADSEEQTEPYYAAIAERGLLTAFRAIDLSGTSPQLADVADLLTQPDDLKAMLKHIDPSLFEKDIAWLGSLTDGERSGLRGLGLRLHTMATAHGAETLSASPLERQIDLYRALLENWLVCFTLPEGTYPMTIPKVAQYALSAINSTCTRIEGEGAKVNALLFMDELSAFNGDQLASTFERGRSAGVHVLVATQSLSNFETAGGTKLLDAAIDNSETLIVHRQLVPESAEKLAGVGGTREAWFTTRRLARLNWMPGGRGLGLDEDGTGTRRRVEEFVVHPNRIKALPTGQAVVITTRPEKAVRVVDVRPGITARRPEPVPAPGAPNVALV